MRMEKIDNYIQYQEIIDRYNRKGCVSNDYMQHEAVDLIIHDKLYVVIGDNNAYFLVQKDKCMRVYYYINDFSEDISFEKGEYVVEILYRGNKGLPQDEIYYLEKIGFQKNLIRDQYFAKNTDLRITIQKSDTVKICFARNLEEVRFACELFNASFDSYSGDYISKDCYQYLLKNKSILIASIDDQLVGSLHQTIDKGLAWISHVAVLPSCRGQHIGQALLDGYIDYNQKNNITRYMLWVQEQNESAIKMYEKRGFKYMNKSTLSMILKNK